MSFPSRQSRHTLATKNPESRRFTEGDSTDPRPRSGPGGAPRPEEQGPEPVTVSPRSQGMHRLPPQPLAGHPACVPPVRPYPVPTHQAGNALCSDLFGPGPSRARRQRRRGGGPALPAARRGL